MLGIAKGKVFSDCRYEPLLPYARPTDGDAYKMVTADFVTTDDGTGIVHIAPSFGADDFKTAKTNGLGSLTLVDKRGRFTQEVNDSRFSFGRSVCKEDYLTEDEKQAELAVQQEALKAIIPNLTNI
jgi:isoleucyl-tRNA synthetase